MLHWLSTVVLLLILAGVYSRKKPKIHLRYMLAAFVLDVSLVLYIEITRHAVEKVAHHTGLLLWFHVLVSVAVLTAYVAQIQLGRRIMNGFIASRQTHIRLGLTFCTLRLVNYITSFMIV
ncbi:MAG: hypothetical protein JNN07_16795 [Verrucomicrobiales bacterium]|nr:hypothetical protein [Verrucomicrobiales bacterium]